jgi:uncharacterized NAD(P)/FAD-binding protein YdhS
VRQRFFEAVDQRQDVDVEIIKATAIGVCEESGGRYRAFLEGGPPIGADVVLLATAYGLPSAGAYGALPPYEVIDRQRLAGAKSMALIGSGLTMVDVLIGARRDGFSGTATVFSRRGQLPQPHAPKGVVPREVALPRSKHISLLTAAVRLACEVAETHGTPWQAIINGIRPSLQEIWQGLPVTEQARFLRHLRPFWDAHRHRLPMEVHAAVQSEFNTNRAVLLQARVTDVERHGEGFRLAFKRRGSNASEAVETELAGLALAADREPDQPGSCSGRRAWLGPFRRAERAGARRRWLSPAWPVCARSSWPGLVMGDHRRAGNRGAGRQGCARYRRFAYTSRRVRNGVSSLTALVNEIG